MPGVRIVYEPSAGRRRIIAITLTILFVGALALPALAAAPDGAERELVRKAPGIERRLATEGARVLEDYGRFLLVERAEPASTAEAPESGSVAGRRLARSRVALPSVQLDTRGGVARSPAATRRAPAFLPDPAPTPGEPGLHLVQFHGPIKPAWLETVRAEGIELVAYVPEHAYLVRATPEQIDLLGSAPFPTGPAGRSPLHWTGHYKPQYKLDAQLLDFPAAEAEVVVRIVDGPKAATRVEQLTLGGARKIVEPVRVDRIWVVPVRMPAADLPDWAVRADVVDITRWHPPELFGEVGALNVAGQRVDGTVAGYGDAGVDYLTWLEDRGFDLSAPWSFAVNVTDTGLDRGLLDEPWHPDFLGPDGAGDRMAYVKDWTSDQSTDNEGVDGNGHGTNCAGVVGGYNADAGTGTATVSTTGYHFGTGVAPAVQLGGSKVFTFGGEWSLQGGYQDVEHHAYDQGARISSNSWGSTNSFAYDSGAYVYDALVRDATPDPGAQPMVILFAAGNSGPGAGSVSSPGTAKNVITLGAAENWWPGYSACGWSTAMNDSPGDDIVYYSSRGPVSDGRLKPDLAAIANGWITTRGQYAGSGCGAPYDTADGTLYRNFNGTSAATPAAAGAAALIYQRALQSWGGPPSPAMVKAALVATARDLAGGIDCTATNGTGPELEPIPNGSQGFGLVDTGRALDGTPAVRVDQSVLFDATGASWSQVVTPADPSKDVRIALAWTDAPGAMYSAPWVNDLDLTVEHLGQTLYGNHLEGGVSVSGGAPDTVNNLEIAVLPASDGDAIAIEVLAANIAGDGVPHEGDATDQDFALYVYNAQVCTPPAAPTGLTADFAAGVVDLSWSAPSGPVDAYRIYRAHTGEGQWALIGTVPAGQTTYTDTAPPEDASLDYVVRAVTDCESDPSAPASVSSGPECMPIFAGLRAATPSPGPACELVLEWDAATPTCPGSDLVYEVHRSTDPGFVPSPTNRIATDVRALGYVDPVADTAAYTYVVRARESLSGYADTNAATVTASSLTPTVVAGTAPHDIPDADPSGITATASVAGVSTPSDVQVDLTILHTWSGDLTVELTSPQGTTVQLVQQGTYGSGDAIDTVFDRLTPPDGPGTMDDFDGEPADGDWILAVADHVGWDVGQLVDWSLELTAPCTDLGGQPGEVSPNLKLLAEPAGGSSVRIRYIPAANATDTCVFSGITTGPVQTPAWTQSTCGLGLTGTAAFDPGGLNPGELLYFVAVATDGADYGSFGRASSGAERPTTLSAAAAPTRSPDGGPTARGIARAAGAPHSADRGGYTP